MTDYKLNCVALFTLKSNCNGNDVEVLFETLRIFSNNINNGLTLSLHNGSEQQQV